MLLYHADTELNRGTRVVDANRRPLESKSSPSFGSVKPVEDLHECRFAGTVFSDDGVDFAGLQREICAVVSQNCAKPFGDAVHSDEWWVGHKKLET